MKNVPWYTAYGDGVIFRNVNKRLAVTEKGWSR